MEGDGEIDKSKADILQKSPLTPVATSAPGEKVMVDQVTPSRGPSRVGKRKLQPTNPLDINTDGEKGGAGKKRRRSLSVGGMMSPTSVFKPALTERQQLALLRQMVDPTKQSPGGASTESSPRDTPTRSRIHRRNERGETPLHLSCIRGDKDTVLSLIDQGADVNATDNAGWTPLHEACNHGHAQVATILLDNMANLNAPGMDGDTPLHDAVLNEHIEVVDILLKRGADPTHYNYRDKNSLDICQNDVIRSMLVGACPHNGATPTRDANAVDNLQGHVTHEDVKSPHPLCSVQTPPNPSRCLVTPPTHVPSSHKRRAEIKTSSYSDISSNESEPEGGNEPRPLKPRLLNLSSISEDNSPADQQTDNIPVETDLPVTTTATTSNSTTIDNTTASTIDSTTTSTIDTTTSTIDTTASTIDTTTSTIDTTTASTIDNTTASTIGSTTISTIDTTSTTIDTTASTIDTSDTTTGTIDATTDSTTSTVASTTNSTIDITNSTSVCTIDATTSTTNVSTTPTSNVTTINTTASTTIDATTSTSIINTTSSCTTDISATTASTTTSTTTSTITTDIATTCTSMDITRDDDDNVTAGKDQIIPPQVTIPVDDDSSFIVSLPLASISLLGNRDVSLNEGACEEDVAMETTDSCSLTVASGGVQRVTSIDSEMDAVSEGNQTTPIDDPHALVDSNDEDSRSTVVSYSTSLPLIFGFSRPQTPNGSPPTQSNIAPPITPDVNDSLNDDRVIDIISNESKSKPSTPTNEPSQGLRLGTKDINKINKPISRSEVIRQRRLLSSTSSNIYSSPHPPLNYDTYLLSTHQYRSQLLPKPTPTQSIYPPLSHSFVELFNEQERDRVKLLSSHLTEVDRLVISFEQELLRAHERVSRTAADNTFSVCSVLIEKMFPICKLPLGGHHGDMKMGVDGHTHEDRLLSGYVQDVWDKFHKESVAMATRHRMEVESLWLLQTNQWSNKLRETGSFTCIADIPSSHVPVTHSGTFPYYIH